MTLDRDKKERRSLASAVGGDVHGWWDRLSGVGKGVRAVLALITLLAIAWASFRGAASTYVEYERVHPRLERHEQRIGELEEDTAAIHEMFQRVEDIERTSQERNRLLNNLEVRMDRVEAQNDRILCYVQASAENTSAFQCG